MTEGGFIERAKHGSLTDHCFYVLLDVTRVMSGISIIMARGCSDGHLIASWETILQKRMVS